MKRPSATAATAASATARARFGASAALLGRGEHGAAESEHRARERDPLGRSPVAIEIANGTIAPQATTGETMLIVPSESAL